MLTAMNRFIPVMTSDGGLCLTAANWKEVGITAASYSLGSLLHKPGYELLKTIPDLSKYLGWDGALILNAQSLVSNREGIYTLRSPYDGSKLKVNAFELIDLIQHLKPDAVILPKKIVQDCPQLWDHWIESITPFFHEEDLQSQKIAQPHGIYFNFASDMEFSQLEQWAHLPRYVSGAFDAEQIARLQKYGIKFIETDEPAQTALQGQIYSKSGRVDLRDEGTRVQFEILDADCSCPTCTQQFTKAYLHHLLEHTPLLCQRFLIQHNVFWMANQ